MDQDERLNNLMPIFLAELDERVNEANQLLLLLEKEPHSSQRTEWIKSLFRTAHSIKGGAMAVGSKALEICCHSLEEIIGLVQKGADLDQELILLLFTGIDAVEKTGMWIKAGKSLDTSPAVDIVPLLKNAIQKLKFSIDKIPEVTPIPADVSNAAPEISRSSNKITNVTDDLVRVSANKLDRLFASMAELLAVSGRWKTHTQDELHTHNSILEKDRLALRRSINDMAMRIKQLRMVPFSVACNGLERMTRDIAVACGKQCRLEITGGEVELDRAVIEDLKDPLVHLIRNAIDHGIESPDSRKSKNKPPVGVINVSASVRGSEVEIKISDDGAGLNLAHISNKAAKQGLSPPENNTEILNLIFQPGFSTTDIVTELSGRGVGLDIVKTTLDRMHGSIDIDYEKDKGTSFSLLVPLTIATQRVLIVKVGGQSFAFIGTGVDSLLRFSTEEVKTVEGKDVVVINNTPIPAVSLSNLIGTNRQESKGFLDKLSAVVVRHSGTRIVFLVDELMTEEELVVKNLGNRIRKTEYISGSALLPNGDIVLILNTAELFQSALKSEQRTSVISKLKNIDAEKRLKLILADDSVTTRSLEKSILESAGYEVITAADGTQAWLLIQEHNPDLVISDVEMPNMDGFRLTQVIRSSQRFNEIPVILVTALASDRDKARGIEVGADAYVVKSEFDQNELLSLIKQLI